MKIILTGAIGYVGEGVMLELLRIAAMSATYSDTHKKETIV